MRFAFIAPKKAEHRISVLCRCLCVARSGFYAWSRRPLSARARQDVQLRVKIRASFEASHGRYGSPRIWEDLREGGPAVSRKRVVRLMQPEGLRARTPKRFTATSKPTASSSDGATGRTRNALSIC